MIFKYGHNYFSRCAVASRPCTKHSLYILIFSLLCLFNNPIFAVDYHVLATYKGTVNIQHWFTHKTGGETYEGTCSGTGTMVIRLLSSNTVWIGHDWQISTLTDTCEVKERTDYYNFDTYWEYANSSHDGTTFNVLHGYGVASIVGGTGHMDVNGQVSGNVLTGNGDGVPSYVSTVRDFRTTVNFSIPLEGTAPPASPPTIQLIPDPNDGLEFQKSIVKGHGFRIHAVDPDGFENIDWSTFKIKIAGVDKTQHFVTTAFALPTPMQQETTENSMTFRLQPGPTQFMDTHNLFNIQWNGNWPVILEVCNRSGACGKTEYSIYFGPFIDIRDARDRRCSTGERELVLSDIIYGNIGASGIGELFIGIQRTGNQQLIWTLGPVVFANLRYGWFAGVYPFTEILFATGIYSEIGFGTQSIIVNEDVFDHPLGLPRDYLEEHALQADSNLQHELVFAVYDRNASDIYIGRRPVELCLPQP